jgi:hypothetical protein
MSSESKSQIKALAVQAPGIQIGEFTITLLDEGKVHISNRLHEGGVFSMKELEEAIHKFFWENF